MKAQPPIIPTWCLVAASLLLPLGPALAQPFALDWFTVAGGGGDGSDGTHSVAGTIGQSAAGGPLSNPQFSVLGGFWAVAFVQPSTPPIFVAPTNTLTINELSTLVYTNQIYDPDGDTNFTWTLLTPISGLTLNPTNGVLTWTPAEGQAPSTNTVLCMVTDSGTPPMSSTGTVIIIVRDVNQAPVPVPVGNISILAGQTLTLQLQANDPDSPPEPPIWGVSSLPAGASLTSNGLYSYTSGPLESGFKTNIVYVYDFNANAVNPASATNFLTFVVHVVGRRVVINTADSGPGSLREAITNTVADPLGGHIEFSIPGSGPFKIAPLTPLPPLGPNTYLDGYTQPGAQPNTNAIGTDAIIMIELSGENQAGGNGLTLAGSGQNGITVRGLCINRFAGGNYGIAFSSCCGSDCGGSGDNAVEGCFIGTDTSGRNARPNSNGILLGCQYSSRVGGSDPAQRNLIAGNVGDGADIGGHMSGTVIQNNLIGTDRTGTNGLPNGSYGLSIGSDGGAVGCLVADNVIAASGGFGLSLGERSTIVVRNKIGVGADGVTPLGNGNGFGGVFADEDGSLIGGTNMVDANIIAFNNGPGVYVRGIHSSVLGNSIFRNSSRGIFLDFGNNGQRAPVLTTASQTSTSLTVTGNLLSLSNQTYRLEFFQSPDFNPSGQPQAWNFLGFTNVTTDSGSNANFSITFQQTFADGFITATATDTNGNTSAISDGLALQLPRLDIQLAGSQVRLLWLTNLSGFILQGNASVVQPTGWADVPGSPGIIGSNFFRDFAPTGAARFFRLRSP